MVRKTKEERETSQEQDEAIDGDIEIDIEEKEPVDGDEDSDSGEESELEPEMGTEVIDFASAEGEEEYSAPRTAGEEEESDDYDSEDGVKVRRSRIGNVPTEWYSEYPHVGYDIEGKQIIVPKKQRDNIERFLSTENANEWRRIHDNVDGIDYFLTNEEFQIAQAVAKSNVAAPNFDVTETMPDLAPVHRMPLVAVPAHKSSFLRSKTEIRRILRMVRAIKRGWINPNREEEEEAAIERKRNIDYDVWGGAPDEGEPSVSRTLAPPPPPRVQPPTNYESYNPPEEYLPTEEEIKRWHNQDPEERRLNFIPKKYSALRQVPQYTRIMKERYERCMDLYMRPRVVKKKSRISVDELKTRLPKAEDFRPFPHALFLTFNIHSAAVACVCVSPCGQFCCTGDVDGNLKISEVMTSRVLLSYYFGSSIKAAEWVPDASGPLLLAVGSGESVFLLHPQLRKNDKAPSFSDEEENWHKEDEDQRTKGRLMRISHDMEVHTLAVHHGGKYVAVVCSEARASSSLLFHNLAKSKSQTLFRKLKGYLQALDFHPTEPKVFIATQKTIRIYDLSQQKQVRVLKPSVKWVSDVAVHPQGDNILMGSFDKKVSWFDLDYSNHPYKILRYHKLAVRTVLFHKRFPIFATCSDDCRIYIFHAGVSTSLDSFVNIVPLKILKAHRQAESLGVLDIAFHPHNPWIFSAGSDSKVHLFV